MEPVTATSWSDTKVAQTGQKGIELTARRAVTFNLFVGLLESDPRCQRQWTILCVTRHEEASQGQEALVMDRSTELRFPLEVEHALASQCSLRGDS
jgi:hypothetical protein